ncbi:MAG: YiiD C-terminal domain-containing protein [Pseudomonadota bacterium]
MSDHAGRAAGLQQRILTRIPLTTAMQVSVVSFDGTRVVLAAPLAPNLNDKGTGFAGSLSTLVTLAGWSLATLVAEGLLDDSGETRCEAAVYRSELDFLRPVRTELRAEAWLADPAATAAVQRLLLAGRRAKLEIHARLGEEADPAVRFLGRYAVWPAGAQPF